MNPYQEETVAQAKTTLYPIMEHVYHKIQSPEYQDDVFRASSTILLASDKVREDTGDHGLADMLANASSCLLMVAMDMLRLKERSASDDTQEKEEKESNRGPSAESH